MMTITSLLAYALIVSYLVIERRLRKGKAAKSVQPGQCDRGTSRLLWSVGLINLLLVLLAPLLNFYNLGSWRYDLIAWGGILLMLLGLTLRYQAAKTLGQFYTRTLQILDDHQVVHQGPYQLIRHPGYLGLSLLEIGAGLALNNWLILAFIAIAGVSSKLYRIHVEEKMLIEQFGEEYQDYSTQTWRLIPFLY